MSRLDDLVDFIANSGKIVKLNEKISELTETLEDYRIDCLRW